MSDSTPAPASSQKRGPRPSPALRAAILAAAADLFAEHGVDGATTRQVAARAQTTERTLFKHFGSKAALAEAVMAALSERVTGTQTYRRVVEETPFTPEEFQRWHLGFLRERIAGAEGAPNDYRVLFRELSGDRAMATTYAAAWRAQVFTPMARQLERMQGSGALSRGQDAEALAAAFFSLNLSYLVGRLGSSTVSDWPSDNDARTIVKLFASLCGWRRP